MGTPQSKPNVPSRHGVPQRIDELENHILNLQYLKQPKRLQKEGGDLSNVEETANDYMQQLLKKLEEKEITIKKLERDTINLKLEKMTVEVSKAKLEEESQRKIDALNSELKDAHRRYLQHLQEKGRLCDKDCLLCCLLWICHKKMDIYRCGRYLEKIITYEACLQDGNKFREELGCGNFMYLLMRCGIIDHAKRIKTYKLPDDINKAWGELMDVDAENLVVIVGRSFPMQLGHCVVCDLKTRDRKNGRLTFHDLQQDMSETGNITDFRQLLKDDGDIKLYTVNFKNLQKIIEKHSDTFHGTYSKYNITKSTDTDDTRIIVDCEDECTACDTERVGSDDERASTNDERIAINDDRVVSNHERVASNDERVASDDERVASDDERVARDDERVARNDERVARDDERVARDDERVARDDERVASDAERVARDDERAARDDERVARDDERVASDAERVARDDERVARDDERAVRDDERVARDDERVASDDDCFGSNHKRVARNDERSSSDTKCVTYGIQRAANGSIHTTCDADRVAHDVQRTVIDSKRLTLEAFMGQNELN